MKSVQILSGFTGYPNGKDKQHFAAGDTPELSNDYADLVTGKQLGRELPPKPKADTPAKTKD